MDVAHQYAISTSSLLISVTPKASATARLERSLVLPPRVLERPSLTWPKLLFPFGWIPYTWKVDRDFNYGVAPLDLDVQVEKTASQCFLDSGLGLYGPQRRISPKHKPSFYG